MPRYAIHNGEEVINVIVAEDLATAQSVTGYEAFESDVAGIGWRLENGEWRSEQPYPSWVWTELGWVSPVPPPPGAYQWNEEAQEWEQTEPPFPSWVWVDDHWAAPVPYPSGKKPYQWDEDSGTWIAAQG